MLKLSSDSKIIEISNKNLNPQYQNDPKSIRPEVVDAKVYKLRSAFIKNSVFVTLSYINYEEQIRPIEIFINSKDLTRAPEYVVLTRLISAIFRRSANPMFILEELQGIFDPNGGSFKEGKYYHSFYAEIADVIERFFYDVGIMDKPSDLIEFVDDRPGHDRGNAHLVSLVLPFALERSEAGKVNTRLITSRRVRVIRLN